MVNSSQSMVASYRYDPYWNTISSSGTLASANLYRFSSKEVDPNYTGKGSGRGQSPLLTLLTKVVDAAGIYPVSQREARCTANRLAIKPVEDSVVGRSLIRRQG